MQKRVAMTLVSAGLAMAAPATADGARPNGWYLQAGLAHVGFDEGASIAAGGSTIAGASATLSDNVTLGVGLGYRFSETFSVIAIGGLPPTTTIRGTGPLSGVTVGKVTYGPLIVAANYHIPTKGKFQPFVGAGINYTMVFDTEDSGITDLKADNAFGGVLRVGFDYMVDDRDGFFFSANKVFVNTTATGNAVALGGAPVEAKIDLNPLILHAGWTRRF
ncbi:OmpW/AlkL family protein [Thalassovita mangrovi]|uniref:Outer membrane beta-barrel protein n=1 Tax=Thalassovita mangrovi TaxID=2692236 RepID=A0A6L8LNF9_9RHOB|nr:OmpW family outer membrane protein [Thalassovita mangrovi]MYM57538.1 outer membrane beta-barrel protein [Thalassovita mangrovi]